MQSRKASGSRPFAMYYGTRTSALALGMRELTDGQNAHRIDYASKGASQDYTCAFPRLLNS